MLFTIDSTITRMRFGSKSGEPMSWTVIIVILFALAMMVGPVLMLQPNAQHQRVAHLRALAIQKKLKVHLDTLHDEEIAVYQIPWPSTLKLQYGDVNWCLVKQKHPHEIHFEGRWEWRGRVTPMQPVIGYVQQHLAQLPESVQALAATPQGLSCYWNERGGVATLETIDAWLKQAQAQLWPMVQREVGQDD